MDLETQINDFLKGEEHILNENANKNGTVIATGRDLIAGAISKEYALHKLLPTHVATAHQKGWIHFHDLDYTLAGYYNCMLIDFPRMLSQGFKMGGAMIEPPKSIRTAAEVIPQIIINVASNIYGGVSAHKIDEILEPYAEKTYQKHLKNAKQWVPENKQEQYATTQTIKEIYDSAQSLEYELNSAFNSNGQTPFVSFSFGLTTTQWGKEIQKAILQVRLNGLGAEKRTAVFPKLIFILKDGTNLNPTDPNYDIKQLALKCASKRIYPDIVSYKKMMELYGYEITPMGCRSFLPEYKTPAGETMSYGRRNIGVCTINLPNIALSTTTLPDFWQQLDDRLQYVYDALMYRFDQLQKVQAKNAPIIYQHGASGHNLDPNENVQKIFLNGEATASVGYTGIHETVLKFYGENWYTNPQATDFAHQIMQRLNHWVNLWKKETGLGFSVYGTPAESLTHRFCKNDQQQFGMIPGITDKGWYTNSFHVVPTRNIDPFSKIDFESTFVPYSTGGNIVYVETINLQNNLPALEAIWDYAYNKTVFYGVNSPVSKCFKCEYEGDFDADAKGFFCHNCNNRDPETTSCIQRMCGYLSEVSSRPCITGRRLEIKARVKHL